MNDPLPCSEPVPRLPRLFGLLSEGETLRVGVYARFGLLISHSTIRTSRILNQQRTRAFRFLARGDSESLHNVAGGGQLRRRVATLHIVGTTNSTRDLDELYPTEINDRFSDGTTDK